MMGTIFDIKEMAVHDGPGLRTTVFFKGCPLNCKWCHNPEGLLKEQQIIFKEARCVGCNNCKVACTHPECKTVGRCIHRCPENCLEIVGKDIDSKELAKDLITSADILGSSFGGFTFSGGEPLAQPDFLFALATELKDYHLCIETCGYTDHNTFTSMLSVIDYVIMDVKIADPILHKKYTGVNNKRIIENFTILKDYGKPFLIRTPLIPNITDTEDNLSAIESLICNSNWEKIPHNPLVGAKYKMLDMKFDLY